MTTLILSIDEETKRFERDDGPVAVHAGETVLLVLKGLGITAETANGTNILPDSVVEASDSDSDLPAAFPYLRVRLVHPVFGDLAMYPWPESRPQWFEFDAFVPGAALACQLDLDTEQLFRVIRSGHGGEILLYVETPWPESVPTVYGTYALRVDDWPEATGEVRVFPASGRYVNAFAPVKSLGALGDAASLSQTKAVVNKLLAAMKALAIRTGEEEE